jgi:hypothetical protein
MQLHNYSQIGCKVTTFLAYNKHFMQDFLHKMHKNTFLFLPFSLLPLCLPLKYLFTAMFRLLHSHHDVNKELCVPITPTYYT